LEPVGSAVPSPAQHAGLPGRRAVLVMNAEDGEVRYQDAEDAQRLPARQRQLLHELEGQERSVREELRLDDAPARLLELYHGGELREAGATIARGVPEHAEVHRRGVGVLVADEGEGGVVTVEREERDAGGRAGLPRDPPRP